MERERSFFILQQTVDLLGQAYTNSILLNEILKQRIEITQTEIGLSYSTVIA